LGLALLDLERPHPGEPDRRGFEWHYWRRRAHGERRFLQGPVTGSDRVWLSPDGRWTTACRPGEGMGTEQQALKLTVNETETGRKRHQCDLPSLDPGRRYGPAECRISFSRDGSRMAALWWADTTDVNRGSKRIAHCVFDLDTGQRRLGGTWDADPA